MITRIKKIIESTGLTDSAFAKKIGMQQVSLWRQLNGERKLSLETVNAILAAFSDIDCNWLIRGIGSMTIGNNDNSRRMDNLIDVIAMQQETIRNLQEKIKQLQNQ